MGRVGDAAAGQGLVDWLPQLPQLPLSGAVPVIDPGSGGRGILLTEELVFLQADGALDTPGELRVDLDQPQGFAHALRWLACRRVDVHSGAWPDGLGGLCLRHLIGLTSGDDRLALAQACAVAVAEEVEWRGFVDAWSALGTAVSGAELDLLMDRKAKLERFGSDLMDLPAEQRVAIVRAHLSTPVSGES